MKKCDIVCIKCPHYENNKKICIKRPKINYLILKHDEKVLKELKINANTIHVAKDIFNLSVNKIGSKKLMKICRGGEFLEYCIKYGLNDSFVKDINRE